MQIINEVKHTAHSIDVNTMWFSRRNIAEK